MQENRLIDQNLTEDNSSVDIEEQEVQHNVGVRGLVIEGDDRSELEETTELTEDIENSEIAEDRIAESRVVENRVVACVDGSRFSRAICDYACWVSHKIGAPITLLHTIEQQGASTVVDRSGSIGLGSQENLLEEIISVEQKRSKSLMANGREILNTAKAQIAAAGVSDIITQQRRGPFAATLSELEKNVCLVIMGIHGENRTKGTGQVSTQIETLVRSLDSPVLVVNSEYQLPEKIMLAYDSSEPAQKALQMVSNSSLFKGLPCHLVYVGNNGDAGDQALEEAANQLRESDFEVVTERSRRKYPKNGRDSDR